MVGRNGDSRWSCRYKRPEHPELHQVSNKPLVSLWIEVPPTGIASGERKLRREEEPLYCTNGSENCSENSRRLQYWNSEAELSYTRPSRRCQDHDTLTHSAQWLGLKPEGSKDRCAMNVTAMLINHDAACDPCVHIYPETETRLYCIMTYAMTSSDVRVAYDWLQ